MTGGRHDGDPDDGDGRDALVLDTRPGAGVDHLPGPDGSDGDQVDTAADAATTTVPVEAAGPTTTTARPTPKAPRRKVPPPTGEGHLVAYSSCDDLLGRTKAAAAAAVGPYGLDSGPRYATAQRGAATAGPAASASAAAPEADGGGEDDVSTTNVQEDGVDEPDLVKTDGRRLVTLTDDRRVRLTRIDAGRLEAAGEVRLPDNGYGHELFLAGDRAVVLGSTSVPQPQPQPQPQATSRPDSATFTPTPYEPPKATLWFVDLSDPGALRIEHTLLLDGSVAAARLADGRIRLAVTTTTVGPDWVYPTDGSEEAQQRATEENRRRVEASTLDDWLPRYSLLEGTAESTARQGRLCACDDTFRPEVAFAGASTVSVVTIDPARPANPPSGSAAVQGWAETVYASKANLYVTTRTFANRLDGLAPTAIHRFDLTDPDTAAYRGSGEVRGTILNQFSLSERGGFLRLATTDAASSGSASESFVTTLAVRDDRLEPAGQVGDLGRGERIYAVRFLDAVAYVVTFRQTDPLYTIDLTDPSHPRKAGELKVPGFSAYLHPIGDGRLLGVGQDATDTGRTAGAQVSSFDVRSIDAPAQVARVSYGTGTTSEVQQDHHAFLWWPAARRALVPVIRSDSQGSASFLSVVEVDGDGRLVEAGRLTHDGRTSKPVYETRIRRSVVVAGVVYTVSSSGILASDLGSLADRAWLGFG
jgi:hypothetical protein